MLDDVERRRFLVDPARKDALPLVVGPLDIDLDERPGQFFLFPRRGRLASAQPDDHVLPPRRLAGAQRDVLDDAVALVEHAQHGDPFGHWRYPRTGYSARRGWIVARRIIGFLRTPVAGAEGEAAADESKKRRAHVYSGIQGS
jgi:hypothetical protein